MPQPRDRRFRFLLLTLLAALIATAVATSATPPSVAHDLVIRNDTISDGSGGKPFVGDVAVNGDRIAVGTLGKAVGRKEIDAKGLAVAPRFVNMLSWATDSLLGDGRAQSDVRPGVTLEVMGEDFLVGPLNPR